MTAPLSPEERERAMKALQHALLHIGFDPDQSDLDAATDAIASYLRSGGQQETRAEQKAVDLLADMFNQFAYRNNGPSGYSMSDGGLSALEDAADYLESAGRLERHAAKPRTYRWRESSHGG